mgnify:CR=1 FL=1
MASVEKYLRLDGILGGVVGAGAGVLVARNFGPFDTSVAMAIVSGSALGVMNLVGGRKITTMAFIEAAAASAVVIAVSANF